jgi:hypothetical protein
VLAAGALAVVVGLLLLGVMRHRPRVQVEQAALVRRLQLVAHLLHTLVVEAAEMHIQLAL